MVQIKALKLKKLKQHIKILFHQKRKNYSKNEYKQINLIQKV